MYIHKIEIYGYGKYVDQTFQLDQELNIFNGLNGSGKSTLMSFILSIMFGFEDQRRKDARQFDSNPQAIFGGRLHLRDTKYGNVVIERTKQQGKQILYLTSEENGRQQVASFSDLWDGMSRDDYLAYFGFDEQDLMNFIWQNEADFSKALMSIGVSGRQVLTHITPKLKQEADSIFLANGQKPSLNQELGLLAESQAKLNSARASQDQYFNYQSNLNQAQADLDSLYQQESQLKDQAIQLELADNQKDSLVEYQALDRELAGYQFYDFSPELALEWQELTQKMANLKEQAQDLQMTSSATEGQGLVPATDGERWIQNHTYLAQAMLAEAENYRQQLSVDSQLNDELVEKRYEMSRLMSLLDVESLDELPDEMTDEERAHWQQKREMLDNDRLFYKNAEAELDLLDKQRSALKRERQSLQRELSTMIGQDEGDDSYWIRSFGIGLIVVGVLAVILFILFGQPFFLGAGAAAGLMGLVFILISVFRKRGYNRNVGQDIEAYQLDLEDIDGELQEIEDQKNLQKNQLESMKSSSGNFIQDLQDFAVQKGGSEYIQALIWLETDYVSQIKTLNTEIQALEERQLDGMFSDQNQEGWAAYSQAIDMVITSQAQLFRQFEDDFHASRQRENTAGIADYEQRDYEKRAARLNEQINQVTSQQNALLNQYGMANADLFSQALETEMAMQSKRDRYQMLASHLSDQASDILNQPQSIQDQLAENHTNLKQGEEAINQVLGQIAHYKSQIREIENSGLVSELDQAHQELVDANYEMAVEWGARQLAIQSFEQATLGEEDGLADRVLSHANRFIYDLSDQRIQALSFDSQGAFQVQMSTGQSLALNQLSRGEKALLFIAMRFAFLGAQLGQVNLPILIDDAFVHLDNHYRDNVYRFLAERSQDNQIIYFTIDSGAGNQVASNQVFQLYQEG
ncbi:hypothetical protein AWM75_06120 [Aerococcus urinaehominis]|uniref:YhaN AAA domain-containing protein n=1 Tax=Aerococcus urinaehominis TaxID=128944 RepID=A0A109RGS7_9LACT|nr:AAA family ATPase [Aerococcus urinaehominis]AMB99581.1 hypothetical protein AWM75_06120 [Aerococcus urinaehominis]